MNKVLVKVFFPQIDKLYDVWIPINKTIFEIIKLLSKGANDLNNGSFKYSDSLILYDRKTGNYYDWNSIVSDTNIKNGTELILI